MKLNFLFDTLISKKIMCKLTYKLRKSTLLCLVLFVALHTFSGSAHTEKLQKTLSVHLFVLVAVSTFGVISFLVCRSAFSINGFSNALTVQMVESNVSFLVFRKLTFCLWCPLCNYEIRNIN